MTAKWKEMETRERLIEGEAVPRKESTNDAARWRYQVGEGVFWCRERRLG